MIRIALDVMLFRQLVINGIVEDRGVRIVLSEDVAYGHMVRAVEDAIRENAIMLTGGPFPEIR
jgi:hypothetical protein